MKVSKELKVGLFMAAGIVLLYFGFNFLKGIDFFSSVNKYYGLYDNVDKLALSNQVYLNGLRVGRVSDLKIEQSNGNRVLVELEINSDIAITDSTVAILSGDFFGNKYILLDMGNGRNVLEPGDTVITQLDKGIAEIVEQAAPVADNLQITLRKLNAVLDNLERNTAKLDGIFADLEKTPKLLNATITSVKGNVNELSTKFSSVATNIDAALADLKPTLANFHELSDSLKTLQLSTTVSNLNTTIAKLNEALTKFNNGESTIGKLMNDDEVYENLNLLLMRLDTLANHLNENPKHFFSPFGKSRRKIEKELKEQEKDKQE